jgi:hypothetical protein
MTPTTDAKGASMQEIPARAALVSAADVGDGLTTSVSREEAKKAIAEDGQLELILDVTRFSDGEPAETRSVAVAWERSDLRRLLSQTEGDRMTLTFDGETLRRAMVDDVEAHGLREKVVVLAVAASAVAGVAASGAAGQSFGADDRALSRAAPATQPSLGADDRALPRTDPLAQPSLGADDRAVPRATPVAEPTPGADDRALPRMTPVPEPTLGPDDRALPRMTPVPEPIFGPDDRAVPRATPVPEPILGPDDRAVPRTDPLAQPNISPDDRNLPLGPPVSQPEPVAATSDDGTWIEAPSPETIAVVGGIALAITGAAFAAVTASRRRVRPT